MGKHEALVGKPNGLRAARTAFADNSDNGHAQIGHAIDIARYLLGRAGIILDGIGSGGKNIGMDGNAFCFRHAHILEGLGIAPGLDRAAVAELGPVAFFLPYDKHGLLIGLFAAPANDDSPGNQHARVKAVFVLAADFRKVVIYIFQYVFQAYSLGMAHYTHAVHRRYLIFQASFNVGKKILNPGQFRIRVIKRVRGSLF